MPNMVGVDIGCGMETVQIKEKHLELQKLDKLIYAKIPSGFAVREKTHKYIDNLNWLQIMHQMKYKAESTARMKHDRFLEENL